MAAPPSSFDGCLARSRAERTRPEDRRLKFYELRDILYSEWIGSSRRELVELDLVRSVLQTHLRWLTRTEKTLARQARANDNNR
jgi:hypothetical protein